MPFDIHFVCLYVLRYVCVICVVVCFSWRFYSIGCGYGYVVYVVVVIVLLYDCLCSCSFLHKYRCYYYVCIYIVYVYIDVTYVLSFSVPICYMRLLLWCVCVVLSFFFECRAYLSSELWCTCYVVFVMFNVLLCPPPWKIKNKKKSETNNRKQT